MVYITTPEGIKKKYACIKCIKGHRSSKCMHTERELIEVKKKGRPVSQCESCRFLRKTRHVHAKCKCHPRTDLLEAQQPSQSQSQSQLQPQPQSQLRFCGWQPSSLQISATSQDDLIASTSCFQCSRPKLYCICSLSRRETPVSSSSSEGSLTPPVYNKDTHPPCPSAGLTIKQKLNLRHLIIPIHDPSDDIDSDTPIYKPSKEEQVDKQAVLGELSNKSSEELMDQIYSGFRPECSFSRSSHLKNDEDDALIELSKQDSL